MSATAGERRALVAPRSSAVWPIVFLLAVAGVCWVVTAQRMQGMDMGPGTDLGAVGWFVVVWVTMMAAMMLPSLSPVALGAVRAPSRGRASTVARTGVFAAGYLLPWIVFGLLAYLLVDAVRSLDLGVLSWSRAGRYVAGGVVLISALYELTPAKRRCLRRCRESLLLRRRSGIAGALIMGVEQGGFCVGCSGALMASLFALGVMSIAWMLVIATLIALEKLLPRSVVAVGATAAVLAVLSVVIVLAPDQVPWLTIPMSA